MAEDGVEVRDVFTLPLCLSLKKKKTSNTSLRGIRCKETLLRGNNFTTCLVYSNIPINHVSPEVISFIPSQLSRISGAWR